MKELIAITNDNGKTLEKPFRYAGQFRVDGRIAEERDLKTLSIFQLYPEPPM